jgi:HEAT repeat protein
MIQLISQMLPYLPAVARFQAGQDEPPPILCYASLGLIILLLVYSIYHSASMKQRMANPQRMLDKKDYGALLAALRYKAANADAKSLNTRLGAAKALRELGAGPGGAKPISDSLNNRIVGHLIQASADKAPAAVDLRANATAALGAYAARITNASLRGRTVTALRDRLADHASVCLEAVKSMGRITSAWALEPIVAANRQNRPDAAKGLLQVLGSLNHDLGPGLLNLFNGSKYSPQIRAAAAQALGAFALVDPAVLSPLQIALETEKIDVIRHGAIQGVGATAHPRAIEILAGRLKKAAPTDRAVIASALEQHGWTPGDATSSAAYAITMGHWEDLKALGKPAIEQLIGDLQYCGSDDLSTAIPETLAAFGEEALPLLLPALHDTNATRRRYAAVALGKIGAACRDRRIAAGLAKLLDDVAPEVVKAALDALACAADPQSAPSLTSYLVKETGNVKSEYRDPAFAALKKIGQPAIPALIPLLEDQRAYLREGAARALEHIGWQPGMDEIGAKYWIILRKFERCAPIGEAAVQPLIQALGSEDGGNVPPITSALSATRSPSVPRLLLARLSDKQANVVMHALTALGLLADPSTISGLIAFLKSVPDVPQYRDSAFDALQKIGQPAVPALIALMNEQNGILRTGAIQALRFLDWQPGLDQAGANYWIELEEFGPCAAIGEAAVQPLVSALTAKAEKHQDVIFAVLRQIGRPAEPALAALLGNGARPIREKATLALQSMDWQPGLDERGANYWINLHQAERCIPIGQQAISPLVWLLTHGDAQERPAAADALVAIGGPEAVSQVLPLLRQDASPETRQLAVSILDKISWLPSNDENGANYWIASGQVERCIRIGATAVPALLAFVKEGDRDQGKVAVAIQALGSIGDPRAADPLVKIAFAYGPHQQAARSLIRSFAGAVIKPLIPHLQDISYEDRCFAAESLLYVYNHAGLSDSDRALLLQQRAAITQPRKNENDHSDRGHSENWYRSNDCTDGHSDDHHDYNTHTDNGIGLPFA